MGDCVEIMTSKISYAKATARGVVVQSSGATKNGINSSKQSFLVNVIELFDSMLLVHFAAMSSGRRCEYSRKEYGSLRYFCDVTPLKYFGRIPFHIIETEYRLRKVDAVDITANPIEHEEVGISRKN